MGFALCLAGGVRGFVVWVVFGGLDGGMRDWLCVVGCVLLVVCLVVTPV